MNSIVERLRDQFCDLCEDDYREAADLIEQQAERIKELEAALHIAKHNEQCTHNANVNLCKEIAALRQRIDDAPVVAHITEDGKVFSNGFVRDTDKPLISKEDLK